MTLTHRSRSFALSALGFGLLWSASQQALAQEDPTWYQVEVIIFERTGGGSGAESWPRNIQLRYPFNWEELKDPDAPGTLLPDFDSGRADFADENDLAPEEGPLTVDLTRRPYFYLPEGERTLNRYANALSRQSEHQVLFHEAWRQPTVEQQFAPALLITGGELFGDHYELEGSITLSVSRYLHLHTRLWLTEFEPNFGQPPGAWPELPRRPNLQAEEQPTSTSSWDDPWAESQTGFTWDTSLNETSSRPNFLGEDFLPGRIATMTQQRRMRSRELHYLDHPLFGLIIEVTPYEHPDEQEEDEDQGESEERGE